MSNDILWIKSCMPGVVTNGSNLVSKGLISCLQNDHAIDLLCLRLTAREEAQAAEPSCPFRNVFVADSDNAGGIARRIGCRLSFSLRSELTSTPRSVFYESGHIARALLERVLAERRYRRIIAEYYTIAPLLEGIESQTSLVLHDADHLSIELDARREPSLPRRAWLYHRAAQMRAFVKRVGPRFDSVLTLTPFDRQAYEALGIERIESLDVPLPNLPAQLPTLEGESIAFLGSVDYPPNRDALAWFLADVFPAVLKCYPAARVQVFGGGNQGGLRSPNVDWMGRIPQREFTRALGNSTLGIAPIRLGSGVKVKVLDMMWHGLPIVCTTLASRGTPAEHGAALIADTSAAFAEAVCELLGSRARRIELQAASQKQLFERHASPAVRACVARKLLGGADASAHPLTPEGDRSLCGSPS
ncbi:MAG: glycosyltransferase [Planctomycetia bacterium]